jgi:hypothetical protein
VTAWCLSSQALVLVVPIVAVPARADAAPVVGIVACPGRTRVTTRFPPRELPVADVALADAAVVVGDRPVTGSQHGAHESKTRLVDGGDPRRSPVHGDLQAHPSKGEAPHDRPGSRRRPLPPQRQLAPA